MKRKPARRGVDPEYRRSDSTDAIEKQIGENLRMVYRLRPKDGIPDRMQALVGRLRDQAEPS